VCACTPDGRASQASLAKLYGSTPEETLLIDEVCETATELLNKCPQSADAEAKKALRTAFAKDAMPKMFAFLSQRLRAGPFYGGEKLNLADLTVFAVVDGVKSGSWDYIDGSFVDAYPALASHLEAVRSHPLVVEHGHLEKK
jgi:glutathione S-transferase